MKNGDRIRHMTDEELSYFIGFVACRYELLCKECTDNGFTCHAMDGKECKGISYPNHYMINWLKQESES